MGASAQDSLEIIKETESEKEKGSEVEDSNVIGLKKAISSKIKVIKFSKKMSINQLVKYSLLYKWT